MQLFLLKKFHNNNKKVTYRYIKSSGVTFVNVTLLNNF